MYRYQERTHPLSNPKKIRGFLAQTAFWVDGSMQKVYIREMDADRLFATMAWLLKRATGVKFAYEMYHEVKGADADKLEQLKAMPAETFMRQMPLFEGMRRRYLRLMKDDEIVIPTLVLDDIPDSDDEAETAGDDFDY